MSRLFILVLTGALTLSIVLGVAAQQRTSKNIEIRVWESTADSEENFISARPEGGSWRTLGTIPIPLDAETSSGSFRYGDITLAVPIELPEPEAPGQPAFIEVTCTYGSEVKRYNSRFIEDDYWWEFSGEITQHLPFDIDPRLHIELSQADGKRVKLIEIQMDEQAPGRKVTWDYGSSYSTDVEDLEFTKASLVYVDDGYSDDRRIYLEPPVECVKTE